MLKTKRILAFIVLSCVVLPFWAQEEETRQGYIKHEFRVPMRDGVNLFTVVYTPTDTSRTYPFLMTRTPYSAGPYGADRYRRRLAPFEAFRKEGFIFVFQDVRGRYMSEGEFVNMRPHIAEKKSKRDVDESTDTHDTVAWLLENIPNHNGKVGIRGVSYPGFYAAAVIIDSHPAIVAASPQAPISDWFFDDMHHHGAFCLNLAFNFFSGFGKPRPEPTTERARGFSHPSPDGYRFFLELGPLKNVNEKYFHGEIDFWNKMTEHPNYDEFWQSRNIIPHLKNVNAAVMVVGGLYDAEDLYGPFQIYQSIEKNNPNTSNMLVMGPWRHGGWIRGDGIYLGSTHFGFKTAEWYRENVDFPFFMHHLKDGPEPDLPEALVFETGANRWRRFDAWPPKGLDESFLYLRDGGGLSFEAPDGDEKGYDEFVSDPDNPVPYTPRIRNRWEAHYMAEDQRFAATRPDVMVYESEVLTEEVTIAGPIEVELWVSTDAGDADWIVKVIDVQPPDTPNMDFGGQTHVLGHAQLMVRSEMFRGRFRESYEHPKPFEPNKPTKVVIPLQDVLHTFKRGHRIMIHVQSSFFPFVDRNPQKWVPNIFEANEEDFIKARHRVYFGGQYPGRLKVGRMIKANNPYR
jgi:hypothetical protein